MPFQHWHTSQSQSPVAPKNECCIAESLYALGRDTSRSRVRFNALFSQVLPVSLDALVRTFMLGSIFQAQAGSRSRNERSAFIGCPADFSGAVRNTMSPPPVSTFLLQHLVVMCAIRFFVRFRLLDSVTEEFVHFAFMLLGPPQGGGQFPFLGGSELHPPTSTLDLFVVRLAIICGNLSGGATA